MGRREMTYATSRELRDGYVIVRAEGRQTLEDNLELAQACISELRATGLRRLLIDITGLDGQPGMLDDFEAAKLIDVWTMGLGIERVAMVESVEALSAGRFFETAVRNRGVNLMVFTDEDEAARWLRE